ncbi:MAG: DUF1648 domain-containing protein [Ignavibacteriales bacterium]
MGLKKYFKQDEFRPKIKINLSEFDRKLELTGLFLLIVLWVVSFFIFKITQGEIPTHFDFSGNADNYGSRNSIFLLPVIGTLLFLLMTWLNKYPHKFNYTIKITTENAEIQYSLATRLIRWMKIVILLIFILITLFTYSVAVGGESKYGVLLLPVIFILSSAPVIIYLVKAAKKK